MVDAPRPKSRREARELRATAPADGEEPTLAHLFETPADAEDSSASEASPAGQSESPGPGSSRDGSGHHDGGRRKRSPRRRRWTWAIIIICVLAIAAAGAFTAKTLYDRAMSVRGHLQQAITEVTAVRKAILTGDADTAATASASLSSETKAAVGKTDGRMWAIAEAVPVLGNNFRAIRIVAETTDSLAQDVVAPASAVSLDAFRPVDGRIDLAAVTALGPLLETIDGGLAASTASLSQIDRTGLIGEVASGVTQLTDAVEGIQPLIAPARDIVSILPNALGGGGPREYLLMFQGNSEARSLGGNPAVFLTVRTDNGAIGISGEAQSRDFLQNRQDAIIPLSEESVAIYGDKIGRFTPDLTMVPDYPEAVSIAEGWWKEYYGADFDAVISLDPVALAYVLEATGPVALPDGETLTADNAVPLLLNEVYFRYNPDEQNVFFGAAAAGIFAKIVSGAFAPDKFVAALDRAGAEGRLLYFSRDPHETELMAGSRMAGVMPADSDEATTVGVFVNDNTGSKKSYYLDMGVETCRAPGVVAGAVTLTSSLDETEAARLPDHILGVNYPEGDISSYVVIYGPQGSTLQSLTLDGEPVSALASGQHLGRPAYKVEVFHHLAEAHTLAFAFASESDPDAAIDVWHTPMTRETAISHSTECASN